MINKHCRHPSIVKVRENIYCDSVFNFQCIRVPDNIRIIAQQESPRVRYDAYEIFAEIRTIYSTRYCEIGKKNSIVKCVFPGDLKFAGMMSPLFKKEYALNKTNYRHVSILNALTKIYEKALSLQISEYFSNVSFALLSAVRKGYSCKSTLLNMIENFKCAIGWPYNGLKL